MSATEFLPSQHFSRVVFALAFLANHFALIAVGIVKESGKEGAHFYTCRSAKQVAQYPSPASVQVCFFFLSSPLVEPFSPNICRETKEFLSPACLPSCMLRAKRMGRTRAKELWCASPTERIQAPCLYSPRIASLTPPLSRIKVWEKIPRTMRRRTGMVDYPFL